MKFPNIQYLITKAKESFIAYPATIISAFIAVSISVYLVEFESEIHNKFPYINAILTFALAIPLCFCSTIIQSKIKKNKYVVDIICSLILILIYFSLPNQETTFNTSIPYIRYAIFNVIAHLLVSFVFFLKKGELNGFWNYNKTLFIRLCTSVLYSGFLYLGIVLALTALHLLFDIDIDGETYFQIFIIVIGLFNTWFFVTGISKDTASYNSIHEYPKGLKIFTQYILLPLLAIYLMILYAYGAKIIITQNWPKGIVSYLITIVSVLGIFTFLLIYPYAKKKGNAWIKTANLGYYYLLLPLMTLLFIAIYLRITDYGVTINRYLICLFGFWVLILAIYFCLKKTNIKFIPTSLAILLFFTSFGPWGMFSTGERSQSNRLIKILEEHQFIRDGKIINEVIWEQDSIPIFYSKNKNIEVPVINDSIHNEIKSILDYLDDHHGMNTLEPLFKQDLKSYLKVAADSIKHTNEARIFMKTLGLDYKHKYNFKTAIEVNNNIKYKIKNTSVTQVSGYDYIFHFYQYSHNSKPLTFKIIEQEYTLDFLLHPSGISVMSKKDTLILPLEDMIQNLYKNHPKGKTPINNELLEITGKTNTFDVIVKLDNLGIKEVNDSLKVDYLNGNILFKHLKQE